MKNKKIQNGYLIRLERNENVMESLRNFVVRERIKSGLIYAIGALKNVRLGYFDLDKKDYLQEKFSDIYELVSLTGNIAYWKEDPVLHLHCVIADRMFNTYGGHLFEAEVAVTFECHLFFDSTSVFRKLDEFSGLKLLDV